MLGSNGETRKHDSTRLWRWAAAPLAVAALTLGLDADTFGQPGPTSPIPGTTVPGTTVPGASIPGAPAPAQGPLDQPLAWLQEGRRNHTAIKDYSCTLLKQESVNGALSEQHVIQMKFRVQPFSIYMRWLSPTKLAGQEVAFVEGRNNNKMRVHAKGLIKGSVGFVSIDVNDPRVLEHSRHSIH